MIANPGGHLQQLHLLDARLPFKGERLWVTADTAQSRSLLADQDVVYVPEVSSRQFGRLAQNLLPAWSLLRDGGFEAAVSTGSGLALAYLPIASAAGVPTHYVESATRTDGPSLTGSLLHRLRSVNMYTQHRRWSNATWRYAGSVFDGYSLGSRVGSFAIRRVVVSLGTTQLYGFRRLVERLTSLLPTNAHTLWQTGCTDCTDLGIANEPMVPSTRLEEAIRSADLVVAHAGTGIALTAFRAGKCPVLVPREHARGEHVDGHQMQTARLLESQCLAVVRRAHELSYSDLIKAASRGVVYDADRAAPLTLLDRAAARERERTIVPKASQNA